MLEIACRTDQCAGTPRAATGGRRGRCRAVGALACSLAVTPLAAQSPLPVESHQAAGRLHDRSGRPRAQRPRDDVGRGGNAVRRFGGEGSVYAVMLPSPGTKGERPCNKIASGLREPAGVAFRDGALYVSAISRIVRFDDIERRLANPPPPVVVSDRFPDRRAPRTQVHRVRAGRQALRPGRHAVQRLRARSRSLRRRSCG